MASTPLFTRPFVVTCLATFFFYLSFYLILPVIPLYVAGMGGTSIQLGLIIGLFAFMAMILRPPAGWIIDTRGSFLVLLVGMAIFFLSSLGYVLARSVDAVLALRLVHGTGMGLFPTAATVVVAELAPLARRGEAMGWFGIANSVGMVFGPAAGMAVAGHMGFPVLFLVAAGVALLGLLCVWMLPRVGKPSSKTSSRPRLQEFFSPAAILPSVILLFLYIPYGAMVAFIPIIATQRGLANAGIFYTVFASAVLLVRAKAGRISDEKGRAAVILPGMLVAAVAFATLGLTSGPTGVLVSAAIYGVAFGAVQPALLALTADRVRPEEWGKAMGTFYTAWELGISSGAVAAGLLLRVTDFPVMWLWSAAMPVCGALLSLKARSSPLPRVSP